MASMSVTSRSFELPVQVWDEIISNLGHDRHLEPLSLVSKTFLSITNNHKQTLKIFDSTAKFLPSLFARFPNLKHISFSEFPDDPVPILHQMADFDFCLETLDLSNHKKLPVEGFGKLPSRMLNGLKSFKMCSRARLRLYDLADIAYFFPNLEELDLSHPIIDDDDEDYRGFSYADNYTRSSRNENTSDVSVSKLRSLRRINFKGKGNCISDDLLILFSKNCPNLEEIVVEGCSKVTRNGVVYALLACKNLKSVGLDRENVQTWKSFTDDLPWPQSLSVISFSHIWHTDAFLLSIVEANLQLKSFTLSSCWGITETGIISFLKCCNSLEYFSLKSSINDILSDSSILVVVKCLTNLRIVKLNRCMKLSDLTFFVLIEHCPLLELVEMKDTNMGKGETFKVKNVVNPAIRSLNLSNNWYLSDESLKKIAIACPSLEMLRLSSCSAISSEGVGAIMRNCGSLKQLRVDRCWRITSLDLDSKSSHKLEYLVASETSLDDNALIDIADKCPDLMFLNLSNCKQLTYSGVLKAAEKCTKSEIKLSNCKSE